MESTNQSVSRALESEDLALLRRGSLVRIQPRSPNPPDTTTASGSTVVEHNSQATQTEGHGVSAVAPLSSEEFASGNGGQGEPVTAIEGVAHETSAGNSESGLSIKTIPGTQCEESCGSTEGRASLGTAESREGSESQASPAGLDISPTVDATPRDDSPWRKNTKGSIVPEGNLPSPSSANNLRELGRIGTFTLEHAYAYLSRQEGTEDATEIISKKWDVVLGAWSWMVHLYCTIDSKKDWNRKKERTADKKQAGAA